MNIPWREVQDFTDPHATPSHQFQDQPVPGVHGSKDDLVNSLLIDDIPLESLWALEDLSDNRGVAGIGKCWQAGVDAEVVEGCEYRVPVPFRCLLVAFRQGEEKFEDFLLGYAGQITFAKSRCETIEDERTGLDGIFFWSWPGGTADENRQPGKPSWCTSLVGVV